MELNLKWIIIGTLVVIVFFILLKKFGKKESYTEVRKYAPPEKVPVPPIPSPSLKQIFRSQKLNHYRLGEEYYSKATSDQDIPNLSKSLEHFKQAFEDDHVLEAGLGMAKIYHYCQIPQAGVPNKQVSRALYEQLIRQSTNPDIRQEANLRLTEINREEQQKRVNEGPEIRRPQPPQVVLARVNIQMPRTVREIPRPVMNQVPRIQGDSQNVHDTSVSKHMKQAYLRLKKNRQYNQHNRENPRVVDEIRLEIPQNRLLALKALDFINQSNASISSLDQAKEKDVLNLVWDRINHPENQKCRPDLIKSLIDQLEDFYPNKESSAGPICAQGRVARVIQSLEAIDANPDLVQTKPMWAVKDEIHHMAGQVRQEILDNATPEEQEAFNLDHEGSADITKRVKGEFNKKIKDEYVNTGLYTEKELKPIIDPILENF